MTLQTTLQVYPDKIAPALSSTLLCLLSDARQDAVAHLRYKDEIGLMETTYSADSKYSFGKNISLVLCLIAGINIDTLDEDLKHIYNEVLHMDDLINPITNKKDL